jgi:hypothetical protein
MGLKALAMAVLALLGIAGAARARAQETTWTIADFRFRTGETLPQMKVHYFTLSDPKSPAAVVLHGTGGTAEEMLAPGFGGALFGAAQPLDAATHYIIVALVGPQAHADGLFEATLVGDEGGDMLHQVVEGVSWQSRCQEIVRFQPTRDGPPKRRAPAEERDGAPDF